MSTKFIRLFVALRQVSGQARDNVYHNEPWEPIVTRVQPLLEEMLSELQNVLDGCSWKTEPETKPSLLATWKSEVVKPAVTLDALKMLQGVCLPLNRRPYEAQGTFADIQSFLENALSLLRVRSFDWVHALLNCVLFCEYILCSYTYDPSRHLSWEAFITACN